ncbi:MAG: bifunctional (p)ppGpp synthetase/guanosine-3',5'-bis(diphosphate) 3'-pyrophosphohydrolase [Thermoflexales bacterium]|nr:bifunctional (p)ppGpp synthetase/guanosine-3',5'-bis(diphosphate) 3'-pyrophosphohydrolase [Thermoflexales bacterium]
MAVGNLSKPARPSEAFTSLLSLVAPRLDEPGQELIKRAFALAEEAHHLQRRKSGEPYILHPIAVAELLGHMNLDASALAAALLHDVVEDTGVTLDDLRAQFGDEIASLVDAVTKLSKTADYRTDREAESLRKMMVGVIKDPRVILIKLADRLHNMRTLDAQTPEKRKKTARETLEIYAPLANRLGMWEWKQELEELGFQHADPQAYESIREMLAEDASERNATINRYIRMLREALARVGLMDVEITGRTKQIYSIWRKMQAKDRTFDQIMDTRAIRVILEDGSPITEEVPAAPPTPCLADDCEDGPVEDIVEGLKAEREREAEREAELRNAERSRQREELAVFQCYQVLGVVHQLWTQIPREFDDYISRPKGNSYRSLHTAVRTNDGKTLEVQIRTRSMHSHAEYGVAAHWLYKESATLSGNYQQYLKRLQDSIQNLSSAETDAPGFVDALKEQNVDQLKEAVFCFTPKGKVIELPKGATVLDFAYHVHTDLGHRCRGARVNGQFRPVNHKLEDNDQVEVLARPDGGPSRDWLRGEYAATASAKGKIRQYFRRLDQDQNIAAGRDIIEREFRRLSVTEWMNMDELLKLYKMEPNQEPDLLEKIGSGMISQTSLASRILEEDTRRHRSKEARGNIVQAFLRRAENRADPSIKRGWAVPGTHGLLIQEATCCKPLPGDQVVGYLTRGQGIRVHRRDCKNVLSAEANRMIDVAYMVGDEIKTVDEVQILITGADRPGLLHDITGVLMRQVINIHDIKIIHRDNKLGEAVVWVKAGITDARQLAMVLDQLGSVPNVLDVQRVTRPR